MVKVANLSYVDFNHYNKNKIFISLKKKTISWLRVSNEEEEISTQTPRSTWVKSPFNFSVT